ncbi:MAG TPA: CHASE3 domain-containing protein, partial [Solimonas sp.]
MSGERRSLPSPLRGVMGIQTRLGLAFAVILLLFAGSALLFRAALTEVEEARQATDHSEVVLQAIDSLLVLVLDQETALRGYLLSSRDEFLKPYQVGGERFDPSWRELRNLTADNPRQQVLLEQWREDMQHWRRDFAEVVLDYKRRDDEASELALVRTGKGKRVIDGIRVLVDQMREHERKLLHERASKLQARLDRTRELTYLMLLAGMAFVALAMWAVARTVTRPVTQLTSLMSRLSSGETDVEIPYRGHGDEIGALARGLEVFRRSTVDLAGREWIKTELSELSVALQGCTTLAEFGEKLSERLGISGGAVCTVFFRWDEARERYEPAGSYSLPGGSGQRGYARGEGLVGQVAQDGEPRVVRDLPESYLRVRSGLGEVVPPSLRLLPLPGRERVLGVVELAYFADPSTLQAEFLKQAAGYAALVLETLER